MTTQTTTYTSVKRLRLRWAARASILAVSVLMSCSGLELVLRTVPQAVPYGVYYGSGTYDRDLGFQLPTSTVVYNKGRYLERTPNADGFMDVEHTIGKPAGTFRVGFFGDSYVESVQVPLDEVFFRLLPERMPGQKIEAFGFGLSGLGTLHARAFYAKYADLYDLDLAVYVFVNNDPADHLSSIQRSKRGLFAIRPTAALTADEQDYIVDPAPIPGFASLTRSLALWVKERSMLARVVYARVQLLSRRGDSTGELGLRGPATWPSSRRSEAENLTRLLMRLWSAEVAADGRQFAVFYVPTRSELGADVDADSWRSWLISVSGELGILVVDPTDDLSERQNRGEQIYGDHWTSAGHRAVADALVPLLETFVVAVPSAAE